MDTRNTVNPLVKQMLVCGALTVGMAVALGAIGSHALESYFVKSIDEAGQAGSTERIEAEKRVAKRLSSWETAVRYQVYHGLAFLALGSIQRFQNDRLMRIAFGFLIIGILLFCGMLYLWVLSEQKFFVLLVPLGGISLILGWACSVISFLRLKQ